MTLLLALRALPWKLIGYLALGLALAASLAALKIERSHTAKLQAQLTACEQARKADAASYKAAQEQAQRLNIEQVRNKEQQYAQNNDKARSAYQTDLARVRADIARRVRAQTGASEGHSGGPGASEDPNAAPGADGANTVQVPSDDLLYGAMIELKLHHLQKWVKEQIQAQQ